MIYFLTVQDYAHPIISFGALIDTIWTVRKLRKVPKMDTLRKWVVLMDFSIEICRVLYIFGILVTRPTHWYHFQSLLTPFGPSGRSSLTPIKILKGPPYLDGLWSMLEGPKLAYIFPGVIQSQILVHWYWCTYWPEWPATKRSSLTPIKIHKGPPYLDGLWSMLEGLKLVYILPRVVQS